MNRDLLIEISPLETANFQPKLTVIHEPSQQATKSNRDLIVDDGGITPMVGRLSAITTESASPGGVSPKDFLSQYLQPLREKFQLYPELAK